MENSVGNSSDFQASDFLSAGVAQYPPRLVDVLQFELDVSSSGACWVSECSFFDLLSEKSVRFFRSVG